MPKKIPTPSPSEAVSTLALETKAISSGRILSEPIEKLSLVEQVQSHVLLKCVGGAIEARLKLLRDPLMAVVTAKGDIVGEKGMKKLTVGGSSVCVESRRSSAPDENKARTLLLAKGISLTEVFDEVKTLVFNPSKLDYLVQTGKVTKEEVAALIPPATPALRVYPSKELEALTEALTPKSLT
jgi:hypothetical protein